MVAGLYGTDDEEVAVVLLEVGGLQFALPTAAAGHILHELLRGAGRVRKSRVTIEPIRIHQVEARAVAEGNFDRVCVQNLYRRIQHHTREGNDTRGCQRDACIHPPAVSHVCPRFAKWPKLSVPRLPLQSLASGDALVLFLEGPIFKSNAEDQACKADGWH